MDQKEIEEKLKNFQVKHIEKPEKKEEQPLSDHEGFCEQWKHAAKILIGIGGEWKKSKREDICEAYDLLAKCLEGRDYFIVTTNTDAEIFRSRLDASRITAPCGNETWPAVFPFLHQGHLGAGRDSGRYLSTLRRTVVWQYH